MPPYPDSNPNQQRFQDQQQKKPAASKHGSIFFSCFKMINHVSDEKNTTPSFNSQYEALNQQEQTMEEHREYTPSEPKKRAHTYPLIDSHDLPGGQNYRPLVGGVAAAAYEAAKSLHYSSLGQGQTSLENIVSKTKNTNQDRQYPSSLL